MNVSKNANNPKVCKDCLIKQEADNFPMVKAKGLAYRASRCTFCYRKDRNKKRLKYRKKDSENAKRKVTRNKLYLMELLGNYCGICDKEYPPACMDFHHVGKKDKGIATIMQNSLENIKKEVSKCILLCSNCHRWLHKGATTEDIEMAKLELQIWQSGKYHEKEKTKNAKVSKSRSNSH